MINPRISADWVDVIVKSCLHVTHTTHIPTSMIECMFLHTCVGDYNITMCEWVCVCVHVHKLKAAMFSLCMQTTTKNKPTSN